MFVASISEQLSGWLINARVKLVGGEVVLREDVHEFTPTSRVPMHLLARGNEIKGGENNKGYWQ